MKVKAFIVMGIITLLSACGVLFSEYEGDGNITINLGGSSAGGGSILRAIDTPSGTLPEFTEIYIKISKKGTTIAEETFKSTDPLTPLLATSTYKFTVPAGSGYRIEVGAVPTAATTRGFSKEYGAVINNVSTGKGSIYIPLSVSGTPLVLWGTANRLVYFDEFKPNLTSVTSVTDAANYAQFFFDQYGYLYFRKNSTPYNIMQIQKMGEAPKTGPRASGINYMSHAPGSPYLYYMDSPRNLVQIPMSQVYGGNDSDTLSGKTIPKSALKGPHFEMGEGAAFDIDIDGTVFLSGVDTSAGNAAVIGKGHISEETASFTFHYSKGIRTERGINEVKLINETLFLFGGDYINKELILHVLDTNLEYKYDPIVISYNDFPEFSLSSICGFNRKSIYVGFSYRSSVGVPSADRVRIYEIDIATGRITGEGNGDI